MNQREIKFRCWDFPGNKWKYVENAEPNDFFEYKNGVLNFNRGDVLLSQSTGLKDKNGKEIYEGDIVKWKYAQAEPNEEVKGKIIFTSGVFWAEVIWGKDLGGELQEVYKIANSNYKLVSEDCEVIGNIYENPELLN